MKPVKPTPTVGRVPFKEIKSAEEVKVLGVRYLDAENDEASILVLMVGGKAVVLNTATTVIKDQKFVEAILKKLK
jgi:hypothetical protein